MCQCPSHASLFLYIYDTIEAVCKFLQTKEVKVIIVNKMSIDAQEVYVGYFHLNVFISKL